MHFSRLVISRPIALVNIHESALVKPYDETELVHTAYRDVRTGVSPSLLIMFNVSLSVA